MYTIPKRLPRSYPRGYGQAHCDICGVKYMFLELRRDGAGRLVCRGEGRGRDEVTLTEQNLLGIPERRLPNEGAMPRSEEFEAIPGPYELDEGPFE